MYRVKFGEKRVLFLFKWDICWFYAQRQNQNEATEEDGEYKFSQLCHTPLLKKLNRARNDLSGKVIPLFKTYQDWEKKIIFEPFDQENLAGQPTILVRLK